MLNRTKIVTVRELNDKRLLEEIGVERDIVVTADPALLLEPEPFDEELLKEEGITTDRHLIGISVREPGSAARNLEESEYHKLLANAADFLADRYEADVVFIPMERADLRESHKVAGEVAYPERCFVLKGSYGPRQLLGLMNHLEIAVGMRLHFLIFAALARVPLLALPYASKVSGFLEALELPSPEALQQEHAGLLIAAIDRLWEQRDEQRRQLNERLPRLQEQAARSLKICLEIAHGKSSSDVAQSEREEEERDTAAASA